MMKIEIVKLKNQAKIISKLFYFILTYEDISSPSNMWNNDRDSLVPA